jgi:hypothetical protein
MRWLLLFTPFFAFLACSGPRATIEIEDARSMFLGDGTHKVVVEVDVLAHEQLGGNIGQYCTSVTYTGQTDIAQVCYQDLSDGDRRTVRLVSEGDLPDSDGISITVRLGDADVGRSLVGPVFK